MMRVRVSYFAIAMQARTTSTSGTAISPIDADPDKGRSKNEWLGQVTHQAKVVIPVHLDLHAPRESRGAIFLRKDVRKKETRLHTRYPNCGALMHIVIARSRCTYLL